MKKKKKVKKKLKKKPILLLLIIIITIVIVLLSTKKTPNPFIGTWISEGGTTYIFINNNEGVMKTPLSENKFTYVIKDNVISIDFKDKKVIDTKYKYSIKGNKCTFQNSKGTFNFTKK